MKFLVAVTFVAIIVAVHGLTDEQKEKVKALKQECIDATPGVDTGLIEKWKKGDFVEDDKVHAFLKCFGTKLGFLKEDGSYDVAVIKQKFAGKFDDVDAVVTECTSKDEHDATKNAITFVKCVHKNKPKSDLI